MLAYEILIDTHDIRLYKWGQTKYVYHKSELKSFDDKALRTLKNKFKLGRGLHQVSQENWTLIMYMMEGLQNLQGLRDAELIGDHTSRDQYRGEVIDRYLRAHVEFTKVFGNISIGQAQHLL